MGSAKITCNTSCSWMWSYGVQKCKDVRDCTCSCGSLQSLNPNLWAGCVQACNSDAPPASAEDYLCNDVGGDTLFNYYGLTQCGYDPMQSAQAVAYEQDKAAAEEIEAKRNRIQYIIMSALGLLIFSLTLALLRK